MSAQMWSPGVRFVGRGTRRQAFGGTGRGPRAVADGGAGLPEVACDAGRGCSDIAATLAPKGATFGKKWDSEADLTVYYRAEENLR